MKKQVHLAFCSGRRTLPLVAGMLARNLARWGHRQDCDLQLSVVYDPSYQGLSPLDFALSGAVERGFSAVSYLGPGAWQQLAWMRQGLGLDERGFNALFRPRGYCSQKNLALIHALLAGADYLLFLDDDEYYAAPFPGEQGGLEWEEGDLLGPHLRGLQAAAITHGVETGYTSPIPADLDRYLGEAVRRRLGAALGLGSEFIGEHTFVLPGRLARCGNRMELRCLPRPLPRERGVVRMSGGNIAFDLAAVRQGLIPPYFNPPGARGEDALLGAQLGGLACHRVGACIFHDPFQRYLDITRGEYPPHLAQIEVAPASLERFGGAFIGWLRYAPLLLRLTVGETREREERLEQMQAEMDALGPLLAQALGWEGFAQGGQELRRYRERVEGDWEDLQRAREAWVRVVRGV
ncbi:MAG: hypothetical protein IT369_16060 [Candidatus Latescibacteria bacterium]|nr:hypothetical protein [Candidatus Latescibacterota bacterium]